MTHNSFLHRILVAVSLALLCGCTATGEFNSQAAMTVGAGLVQASLLNEDSVRQAAALAAQEHDAKNRVAPPDSPYSQRLARITRGLETVDGEPFNFKVYLADEINAFAMADGTVRVHSGLLDAMPDDQVLAVIGHEIGHVRLDHTYEQMREKMLTDAAFQAVIATGGTIGALTSSQLGQLAYTAVNARFSQGDELEADAYAVRFLRRRGADPWAMKRSIETLQSRYGGGGSFLSSHPSNQRRIANIEAEIEGR